MLVSMDYGQTMAIYLGFEYKGLVFCTLQTIPCFNYRDPCNENRVPCEKNFKGKTLFSLQALQGWVCSVEYWLNNGKHGQGTHSTKTGADKLSEKNPKCPKIYLPKLSVQAQKFWILMKKGFIGRP